MFILITGIEGFIGYHMAASLHKRGIQVIGIDVNKPSENRPWQVIVGDVADRSFVERVFNENKITHILHCGGISGPHVCNNDPARVFSVNFLGTLHLFETARKHQITGRIILASSSSVYGEVSEKASCQVPVVENLPLLASEPYGCSKVACESLVRAYTTQQGMDIISLRISIVYGPGRTTYCGITEILQSALAGQLILLRQGRDLPLPWVHIDDIISVLYRALDVDKKDFHDTATLAYNVTGPGFPTFREIATIVQRLIPGATIKEVDEPDPYAMNARKMSLESIKNDLNWTPTISIEKGIRSLWDFYQMDKKN